MPCELVIFDCDGVLVDSEPLGNLATSQVFQECGIPMTAEESHRLFVGVTNRAIKELGEQHFGRPLPDDFVPRLEARIQECLSSGPLEPVPHAREAVEQVIASGSKVCVASNGEVAKMRLTLGRTGLLDLFDDHLIGADMVVMGKPEPEIFLLAATRMGVAPKDTCVVEDSIAGVTAALAAGMRAYAYCHPHDARTFRGLGAVPFHDMRELPGLLTDAR